MSKRIKSSAFLLLLLTSALLLSSCGASSNSFMYTADNGEYFDVVPYASSASISNDESVKSEAYTKQYDNAEPKGDISVNIDSVLKEKSDRKIIYSSWAEVETTEYDKTISSLKTLCSKFDAYFESSDSYGGGIGNSSERYSSFTIRVPSDNYSDFVSEIGSIGTVVNSGENNRDVTDQYYDTEARLESAQLREQRVLVLLENAGSLDDILALERELADIRYEIESYTGSLRKYDSLINYATFTLTVNEVVEYTEPTITPRTFGEKISQSFNSGLDSFIEGWQNFVIFLSYNLFNIITFIVLAAVVAVIIIITIKKRKKKSGVQINDTDNKDNKDNTDNTGNKGKDV